MAKQLGSWDDVERLITQLELSLDQEGVRVFNTRTNKWTKELCRCTFFIEPDMSKVNKLCSRIPGLGGCEWASTRYGMVVQRKLFEFNQVGKLLKRDPSTREAVVYEPDYNPDNIACNCVYCFRIRDSKLTLDVYLRSSDIAKLPYDVYTATRMLHSMADWVGNPELKAGSIWFIIGSLHKYVEEGYAKEV